jgi:hypothetical protein
MPHSTLLFNVDGKALPPNAIIAKKRLIGSNCKNKRGKRNCLEVAIVHKKERLAKEVKDANANFTLLSQFLHLKFGCNLVALLPSSLQVPAPLASFSIPIPFLRGVSSLAFPLARKVYGS